MGKGRVLIIGGGFAGLCAARDLKDDFLVTIVDCKEYFEYTPGVLRAYVKPAHLDALTFQLQPVVEGKMGCKFIWGEVTKLDGVSKTASVKPMFQDNEETISYDYCIIASGCNFNFLEKKGESLWFPTVHEQGREVSKWKHIDERFLEGRRRHILEEYSKIAKLADKSAKILISGAGFIGVEFATELKHFFPKLDITIIDFLPKCLGPLPDSAAQYCDNYMKKNGIHCYYGLKYEPQSKEFWSKIGLPNGADETYLCMGVKASNYFMPAETLSDKGPGGGGWILMNKQLQVMDKQKKVWGDGCTFVVGDANYSCIEGDTGDFEKWPMAPVPKISYPGEEQAVHACHQIHAMQAQKDGKVTGGCCAPSGKLMDTWWPWGAGMFATSLGPHDACFVAGANWKKGSGVMCLWGWCSAIQKEIIEASKVNECAYGLTGRLIWHFVHHTPVHLWGAGKGK